MLLPGLPQTGCKPPDTDLPFLTAEENGFKEMTVDPLNDIIEEDLLEQLTEAFVGVDTALRMMQADMTKFVLERLRIDSLTKGDSTSCTH